MVPMLNIPLVKNNVSVTLTLLLRFTPFELLIIKLSRAEEGNPKVAWMALALNSKLVPGLNVIFFGGAFAGKEQLLPDTPFILAVLKVEPAPKVKLFPAPAPDNETWVAEGLVKFTVPSTLKILLAPLTAIVPSRIRVPTIVTLPLVVKEPIICSVTLFPIVQRLVVVVKLEGARKMKTSPEVVKLVGEVPVPSAGLVPHVARVLALPEACE